MGKSTSCYPSLSVDATGRGVVSHGGAIVLLRAAQRAGLTGGLSGALAPRRKPLASHDPGKVVLDLAVALAMGGIVLPMSGCCAPSLLFSARWPRIPPCRGASPRWASDAPKALAAIAAARLAARSTVWAAAGEHAPDHGIDADHPLIIDLDATLVTAHSDKEKAAPNFKRGFGFHPLCAFVDHGGAGSGEPLAILRPGNAGSNTAADHKQVLAEALAQLPSRPGYRVGRSVLVRADAAGTTHEFVNHLSARRLAYSIGFTLTETMAAAIEVIPESAWTPAHDADGQIRDGAWVAEATGVLDLSGWPAGMRVIVRKERPIRALSCA